MQTSLLNQKSFRHLIPREEVLRLLKERHVNGLSLNQNQVKKENVGLYHSVVRYWVKWSAGLKWAGIPARKYRYWTKERVMEAVKQRYQLGLSLSHRVILEEDPSLIVQIRKYYGSKKSLLQLCEISLGRIRKDGLLEILKNLHQQTGRLNSGDLRRMKIYGLMLKYFGSKTNAYQAIGLDDKVIRKLKRHPNKWSEDTIIKIIQELIEKDNSVSGGKINKTDPSLYRAARTHFGSWAKALQNAGIHCTTPKVYKKPSKWNKIRILEKLKNLLIRYKTIERIPLEERFKYYWLCRRHFGSTKEAWRVLAAENRVIRTNSIKSQLSKI
jgi:hypothetical protein